MVDHDPLMENCNLGCHQNVAAWHVPDKLWTDVTGLDSKGQGGSYCMRCFDLLAQSKGIYLFWEAREGYYPTSGIDGLL